MKRFINNLLIATAILLTSSTHAQAGLLFKITESGAAASVDVILCLNGNGPLSCQNYHIKSQNLQISTTSNHRYPAAGIKVLTRGYKATGCTSYPNGYCLFAVSNSSSATLQVTSGGQKQNQTISFTSNPPSATVGGPAYTPTAIATSGLPVLITVNSSSAGICSVSGGAVSFTAAGTCILNGNQAGDLSYNPAPQVQQSISVTSVSASLNISSPKLVLAQKDIFSSASGAPAAASKSRTLTITNQGQATATNLSIAFNPALSGGTSVDTTAGTPCLSGGSLAPNSFCTVTIAPGTPSSIGSAPVTNTLTVTASNASNSVTSDIITLTYGSLYGNGYVFSIDDSPAPDSSVGLVKVVATSDQRTSIRWDADPACGPSSFQCTYATGAISTTNGTNLSTPAPDGNTYLIWNKLTNTLTPNPPFPEAVTSYAAGACVSYNEGGHTDWYLPAICEMSYFAQGDGSANCGSEVTPLLQNMQSNLIDIDSASSVASGLYSGGNAGYYWSSTEYSGAPLVFAWYQSFASSGGSGSQDGRSKGSSLGVRCARGFTN